MEAFGGEEDGEENCSRHSANDFVFEVVDGGHMGASASFGSAKAGRGSVAAAAAATWRSTRTFREYPVRWVLRVPEAELELEFSTATPDQEFISFVCAHSLLILQGNTLTPF